MGAGRAVSCCGGPSARWKSLWSCSTRCFRAIDILNALANSTGDLRGLLALIGLTTAVSGAIVLACPGVTILVVAIVIGVQLILAGLAQIVLGLRFRPA